MNKATPSTPEVWVVRPHSRVCAVGAQRRGCLPSVTVRTPLGPPMHQRVPLRRRTREAVSRGGGLQTGTQGWGGGGGDFVWRQFGPGKFREGKISAQVQFRCGAIRCGKPQHPQLSKKCGLFCTRKLTNSLDYDPLLTPGRARGTKVKDRRTADNSATLPGYRHQRGCTRSEKYPKQRKTISWENVGTKLKNEIFPTKCPYEMHPL